MVDGLKSPTISTQGVLLHQLLHGYSDGHRLIESSFKPHDDLTRLMLRMSDLSGSSMVNGFEEYITGYPLAPINAYALAKTWYAPEMPRPGCVWTHTIAIPDQTLAEISNLRDLLNLFRRPTDNLEGSYSRAIPLESLTASQIGLSDQRKSLLGVEQLLYGLYENTQANIVVPSANSKEYEAVLFAVWSQQWLALRKNFTFCTGALSTRIYAGRPFVVQCVPKSLLHEVLSEATSPASQTLVLNSISSDMPTWTTTATKDVLSLSHRELRKFLWSAADPDSDRNDYVPFTKIFDAIKSHVPIESLVDLVGEIFPEPNEGKKIKTSLFGLPKTRVYLPENAEEDVLLALGKTDNFKAFSAETLRLNERGKELCMATPLSGRRLLGDLFRAANPHGEIILAGLISGLDAKTAHYITTEQPQFLPALFRAKPSLACSPELWAAAGSHNWQLLESLVTNENLDSNLIQGITGAILDSESDFLISRALEKWGKTAVFGALDWIESHPGKMTETCRKALTYHDGEVFEWVESAPSRSLKSIVSAAHIVAPYSHHKANRDSTVWFKAFRELVAQSDEAESTYMCTFLLALAFGNATPNAITLISETFVPLHRFFETAYKVPSEEKLADESWFIMDPIVPHLNWFRDWDKCERLRRGLAGAFIKHRWPASELSICINDLDVFLAIIKSSKAVNGGEDYFQIYHNAHR